MPKARSLRRKVLSGAHSLNEGEDEARFQFEVFLKDEKEVEEIASAVLSQTHKQVVMAHNRQKMLVTPYNQFCNTGTLNS